MSGKSPESVSKDFEELFGCFNAKKVKALIVGGYALAYHAKPRYTKDVDLWVEATPAPGVGASPNPISSPA
jgi:hypothetical protein